MDLLIEYYAVTVIVLLCGYLVIKLELESNRNRKVQERLMNMIMSRSFSEYASGTKTLGETNARLGAHDDHDAAILANVLSVG